ncbi:hypothetical protein VIGAN_01062700 [Vigna angularis var. angularis]|uniref:Uncharacterized protein n=1 Tax=Vigna angularis var. angularis TaxID=157739 RepID=A0A0S3QXV7_PHAAN|nr:hypothetical protein VIGAN_01062700 [Vigna angularis var. angularis]
MNLRNGRIVSKSKRTKNKVKEGEDEYDEQKTFGFLLLRFIYSPQNFISFKNPSFFLTPPPSTSVSSPFPPSPLRSIHPKTITSISRRFKSLPRSPKPYTKFHSQSSQNVRVKNYLFHRTFHVRDRYLSCKSGSKAWKEATSFGGRRRRRRRRKSVSVLFFSI